MLFLSIYLKIVYLLVLPPSKSVALEKLPRWYFTRFLWHIGAYSMPKPDKECTRPGPSHGCQPQGMTQSPVQDLHNASEEQTGCDTGIYSLIKALGTFAFFIDSQFQILPTLGSIIQNYFFFLSPFSFFYFVSWTVLDSSIASLSAENSILWKAISNFRIWRLHMYCTVHIWTEIHSLNIA